MKAKSLVSVIFEEIGATENLFEHSFRKHAPKKWYGETYAFQFRKTRRGYMAKVRREAKRSS